MELFNLLRQVEAKAGFFAFLSNVIIVGTDATHCEPVAVMKMPFRSHVGSTHNWLPQLLLFWIQCGGHAEVTLSMNFSDTMDTNTLGILIQPFWPGLFGNEA